LSEGRPLTGKVVVVGWGFGGGKVRTIWKYQLGYDGEYTIRVPYYYDGSDSLWFENQCLVVSSQKNVPTIWVMVDDDVKNVRDIDLVVVGTGSNCNHLCRDNYLGSCVTHDGDYVWHVFMK
jgi:hypothetical protein